MSEPLPLDQQDTCKFCGQARVEDQGNSSAPRCPTQGCPGQHVR
jgi:hypothetical protein